jgi:hypothetical protein
MPTVIVTTPRHAPPLCRPEASNPEGSMSEIKSDRGHEEVAHSSSGPPDARTCPQCRSADLLALGRVLADHTGIRSTYRCRACATEFLLLHHERRAYFDSANSEP